MIHRRQHAAIGQHAFQAQHMFTCHAVANDLVAACIGGQIAANRARASRSQIDGEVQARSFGGILNLLQRGARPSSQGAHQRVDVGDTAHFFGGQDHALFNGVGAASQAGQATLGDHRGAQPLAVFEHVSHLLGVSRIHNAQRNGAGQAAPVLLVLDVGFSPCDKPVRPQVFAEFCGEGAGHGGFDKDCGVFVPLCRCICAQQGKGKPP